MSQVMQYRFRLFGAYKGRTMSINGHRFVNGEAALVQSSENMGACMRVLSFYGAYAYGTPDFDAALKKEEAINGGSEVHTETKQGQAVPVRGDVRPNGSESTKAPSDVGTGHATAETGGTGADPVGDGHGDSGVPKFEEAAHKQQPTEPASNVNEAIKAAVMKLDPSEDGHWVATGAHAGRPKLSEVEKAYGRAGVTRKDVEAALPGWNRDTALEAVLAA